MHARSGFSYIGLLILLALMSLLATTAVQVGAVTQRRVAEQELLDIGLEFKNAVRAYYENTPVGTVAVAPRSLQELLRDPRYPGVRRYLRKIYNDPLTGNADWGLIYSPEGGVLGVYSKAQGEPIRQDNFPDEFFHFKGKKRYRDWVFVYGVVCTDAGCELPPQPDDAPGSSRFGENSAPAANALPAFGEASAPALSN